MRRLLVLALGLSACTEPMPAPPSSFAEVARLTDACGTADGKAAYRELTAAVQAYPRVPDAHAGRGSCGWMRYRTTGDVTHAESAIDDYTAAITLVESGHTTSRPLADLLDMRAFLRAAIAVEEGDGWDLVAADFDWAIRLAPTPQRHLDRGVAHVSRGDRERALADFEAARRLGAGDASITEQLRHIYALDETVALLDASG